MGMKFLKEAVYSEKYKTKDGEEKTKYTNVGALFEREDGSLCAKILGSWVSFYDKKEGNTKNTDKHTNSDFAKSSKHYEQKQNGYAPEFDDSDIPF